MYHHTHTFICFMECPSFKTRPPNHPTNHTLHLSLDHPPPLIYTDTFLKLVSPLTTCTFSNAVRTYLPSVLMGNLAHSVASLLLSGPPSPLVRGDDPLLFHEIWRISDLLKLLKETLAVYWINIYIYRYIKNPSNFYMIYSMTN